MTSEQSLMGYDSVGKEKQKLRLLENRRGAFCPMCFLTALTDSFRSFVVSLTSEPV